MNRSLRLSLPTNRSLSLWTTEDAATPISRERHHRATTWRGDPRRNIPSWISRSMNPGVNLEEKNTARIFELLVNLEMNFEMKNMNTRGNLLSKITGIGPKMDPKMGPKTGHKM